MGKEGREISRFFVAPPRVFPLSVWRVSRTSLTINLHPLVQGGMSFEAQNIQPLLQSPWGKPQTKITEISCKNVRGGPAAAGDDLFPGPQTTHEGTNQPTDKTTNTIRSTSRAPRALMHLGVGCGGGARGRGSVRTKDYGGVGGASAPLHLSLCLQRCADCRACSRSSACHASPFDR